MFFNLDSVLHGVMELAGGAPQQEHSPFSPFPSQWCGGIALPSLWCPVEVGSARSPPSASSVRSLTP